MKNGLHLSLFAPLHPSSFFTARAVSASSFPTSAFAVCLPVSRFGGQFRQRQGNDVIVQFKTAGARIDHKQSF